MIRVKDLVEALQQMPQDLPVAYLYDGATYGSPCYLWVSKDNQVVLSSPLEIVDFESAPQAAGKGWCTPEPFCDKGNAHKPVILTGDSK